MRRLVLDNIPASSLDSLQTRLCRPFLVRPSRVLVYMIATRDNSLPNKILQACFERQFVHESKIQAGYIEQRLGNCTFHPACHAKDFHLHIILLKCLPQLSDFVPLKNGFYSFRAQTDYHHPVDPGTSYTVVPTGVADLFP